MEKKERQPRTLIKDENLKVIFLTDFFVEVHCLHYCWQNKENFNNRKVF